MFGSFENKEELTSYLQSLKARLADVTVTCEEEVLEIEKTETKNEVLYTCIKDILLAKKYDLKDRNMHEFLEEAGNVLISHFKQARKLGRQDREIMPILKTFKQLMDNNQRSIIEIEKHEKIQAAIRYIILDASYDTQIKYQCSEIFCRMVRIDIVNEEFSYENIICIVDSLQRCLDRKKDDNSYNEHVIDRLVSSHLLSIYFLCKTRKMQVTCRIIFNRISNIASIIQAILMNFNGSEIRQLCIKILDQIMNVDFNRIFKDIHLEKSIVKLLTNTFPDIIYLAGKMLIRLCKECNLVEKDEKSAIKDAVIILFCKNIVASPDFSTQELQETFIAATCEILWFLFDYSAYAKEIMSILLKNVFIDEVKKGNYIQLSDPLQDMKRIRTKVRSNHTIFISLLEIYEKNILT